MVVVPQWRDSLPKTDLSGGFIGDRHPLCVDLAEKMFLRKGATYQLLGGSTRFHKDLELDINDKPATILNPDPTRSLLHETLCKSSVGTGNCTYPNEVILERTLDCTGLECQIDAARMVELAEGVVYEYVPPPCVELTFFEGKIARSRKGDVDVCAHPRLPVAGSACCPPGTDRARWECTFTGELLTYQSASNRCASTKEELCSFSKVPSSSCDECCVKGDFLWTADDCKLQKIIVSRSGRVKFVNTAHHSLEASEYFRVFWMNDRYPSIDTGCDEGGVPTSADL